jgi:hypothetical protein
MIKPETAKKNTAGTTEPKSKTLNLIPALIRRRNRNVYKTNNN